MTELANTLSDPAAFAQFVAMVGGMAGLKKLACKMGLSGFAGAALSVKDGAETALRAYELAKELDGITYKSEVANAAPHVAKVMAELVQSLGFSAILRRIKCFAAGTQIVVAMSRREDGSWQYETKSIEDIRVGDVVLAREELGNTLELRRVLRTVSHSSDHLRVLEFEDAGGQRQTIHTTDEHPFWVVGSKTNDDSNSLSGRFIPAQHMEVGQTFTGPNGERLTLMASRRDSHPNGIPVYNFEVDGFHTYFVASETNSMSPILTHNQQECFRGMKEDDEGLPLRGSDARTLGARPNHDIPVHDGMVVPGTGGMSVAPRTPTNLPPHRRPPNWRGTGNDPVWGINEDALGPDLRLVPDSPRHGTIQPVREMTWEEYLEALWRTRPHWSKR